MGEIKSIVELILVLAASNILTRTTTQAIGFDVNYSTDGGVTLNEILAFNIEMLIFTLSIVVIYTLIVPGLHMVRDKILPASPIH